MKLFFKVAVVVILIGAVIWFVMMPQEQEQSVDPVTPTDFGSINNDAANQDLSTRLQQHTTGFVNNYNNIPVKELFSEYDATVDPSLLSLLDQTEWDIFKCEAQGSHQPTVVWFSIADSAPAEINLYTYTRELMQTNHIGLFTELQDVLFPDQQYGNISISQNFTFDMSVGTFDQWSGEVSTSQGDLEASYGIAGSEIFLANDPECLQVVHPQIFDQGT